MRHWETTLGSIPGLLGASIGTTLVAAALSLSCERGSPSPGDRSAAPGIVLLPPSPGSAINAGPDAEAPRTGWVPPIASGTAHDLALAEAVRRGGVFVDRQGAIAGGAKFSRAHIRIEQGSSPPRFSLDLADRSLGSPTLVTFLKISNNERRTVCDIKLGKSSPSWVYGEDAETSKPIVGCEKLKRDSEYEARVFTPGYALRQRFFVRDGQEAHTMGSTEIEMIVEK
ncbi:MAG: hypothetical protein SFV15_13180 [Polyangiaceae bacterium]|nr:hypothetical protein [Polyangiaceae bacterium]